MMKISLNRMKKRRKMLSPRTVGSLKK